MVDAAHGGEGWVARSGAHITEFGTKWAPCGVKSESDTLRHVLLRRPGAEIEDVRSSVAVLWTELMNPSLARAQHDALADLYRHLGVKVDYITDHLADACPNLLFARDGFAMTPQGAIVSRFASETRSGEERVVALTLAALGVPIIATAHNTMNLEGPDVLLVDADLAFLGVGLRTNREAAEFVASLLKAQGVGDIRIVQTTYGCGHLDGVVNLLSKTQAVLVPRRASYEMYAALREHGYHVLELNNAREVDEGMAINFVPVREAEIVIAAGPTDTIARYRACGVNCHQVSVSELMKGGGSVHCMTGVVHRSA